MLKNYLKSLLLLLCMIVGAGTAWADGNPDVTYDFTESGWTVSGKTLTNGTVSFVGGPATAASFKMNSGYFMLGKKDAYINFPTYDKAVEKIVVTGRSGASASTKMNIYVGSTAVSTETTGSTGVNTYEIASASQAVGTQYTLKVTSAHNAQITKIEVYYKGPVNLTSFAFDTTSPSVTLSKNGNNYEADYTQTVTVAPTDYNGDITYTVENSTFDTNDVIINDNTGKVTISTTNNVGGTIVVKASGQATAAYNKPADATYTLTVNAAPVGVGTPTFSLPTGAYYYGTTVEIEAVNSTLITYTTDGTNPTMESTTYSAPIAITKTMTLKAKAWDDGFNESEIASIDYTLKAPEAPTFSVEGGEVIQGATVTLTPGEGGSVVVYTTDGTDPTVNSDIYDAPIAVNAAMTIKAATVDDGDNLSAIATAVFTVRKAVVYEKVTDASTLAAGDKLLLVYEEGATALSNINSGGKIYDGTDVTITDSKIADPSASVAVLTLGGTSAGWTLQSSLDGKYLMATNSNELRQNETATTDYEKWTITISDGVASVTNVGYNDRTIKYNKSNPRFACYTSGQQSLALYRLQEDLEDATITISPAENFELSYGGTKVLTVTTTSDGDITATSSDETIATVDKTGENEYTVTAVNGTEEGADATITFSTEKTSTHKAGKATIVATVKDARVALDLSFAETSVEVNVAENVAAPALNGNVGGGAVTYASENELIATVNASTGVVTGVAEGVTTITATVAEVTGYKGGTATFEVTVIDPNKKGTKNNPYTVAEAIDAIDNDGDVTGVYATGVVSEIVTAYNSQYGNISYNISADGTTEAAQLQAYRGKSYNGENFTSEDDIQVGDVVVIYGNLKKYNSTYEFEQDNQLVSLTRKGDAGLSYETTAYYVTVGGTFDAPALTNPHGLAVTYSSSDTEVATVNAETGEVKLGSKVGTTTITASFAGNGEYNAASASYTLTVEYPATTTTLNKTAVELDLADDVPTATLVATVKQGEDVIENATITWTSDDEEVATVDNNGVVTAVAKGTATITATFSADGYKTSSATCEVTVINTASGVIDLAKTGTISFSDFSNAGSYNKTEEEIFVVDGYDFAKFYCMKNGNELQMHAVDGYVILPTIKSTKGYSITVNYTTGGEAPTLLVGDVTKATGSDGTIEYNSESISETVKILAGSKATYVTSITITPIKDNRTLAFSEPTTEILVNGTATNTATATPAGTITYTSSDEEVATVDAEGKVTGVKIGTATITATVAEDADYNEATASYEVTVNGIPAATDIVLTATDGNEASVALNEIEVGTKGTFAATYTKAADNVTVTYTSDATDVLTINDGAFEAAKGGTANVTVTITPDDTEHYVAVSKVFGVTLLYAQKGTTELTIVNGEVKEQTSGNTLYGTNINLTAKLAANYDGTVTASLTNDAIATVAVEGESITITPKAVGTTTITFTAPATANFEGEVTKTYELTVTAPEGQTACEVIPAEVVLNETFSKCDSNGGNDGDFATSSSTSISSPSSATDVEGWTLTKAYEASGCVKLGSSNNPGSATTPSLSVSAGKTYTLTFNAAPWSAESATMTVSVNGGTINGEGTVTTATMTTGKWNSFEYNILATAAEMKIEFTCSQTRFFLDDVKIEIPEVAPAIPDVTIAESGYASFCCEYPLDFTEANENYKAWYVSEVSGTTVTFKQIKGKIAGGVPFFLYGEPGTYHLQVAAESTETLSGNMLVGTLAPTYVESVVGDYTNFGLSAGSFKKMNNGVVKANKAYLPVLTDNISAGTRLNIIFDEEDTPTGISSVNNENLNQRKDVYNLNGQRVENMKKGGLYIVNGKKVFMKGQR